MWEIFSIISMSLGGAKNGGCGIAIGTHDFWSLTASKEYSEMLAQTLHYRMSKYGALPYKYLTSVKCSVVL